MTQPIEIRIKRGTSSYLQELNPVLDMGEPCLETDTNKVKYGDGTTPWNLLAYASGDVQTIGENNEASGTNSVVSGGINNTTSGSNSFVAAGNGNTSSGINSSVLGGSDNTASGTNASVLNGSENTADGENSLAIGTKSKADSYGQIAISSGSFNVQGDAQTSIYNLRAKTISDESVALSFDGDDTSKRLNMPVGVAWNFDIKVSAYDVTNDLAAYWNVRGAIRRNLSGDVSFIGSPIVESATDEDWDQNAEITVRATNNELQEPYSLAIDATGSAGSSIYWHAVATIGQLKPKPPLTSDMFVEIKPGVTITSINCSIDGGGQLFPSFNTSIQDYCVYSANNGTDTYNLNINGSSTTGSVDVNKALHITYGAQEYFIRVIPTDLPMVSITTKTSGYRPGYYLYSPSQGGGGNWFIVFDSNAVPVWYVHDDFYNGFALHYGGSPNKLVFHRWADANTPRHAITLGLNTITAVGHTMKNDATNSNPFWECHESHLISGPPSRKGNFISMTYANGCTGSYMPGNGVYIQELTPDGQTVVWDWYSDEYFNISEQFDYFHANSIDVHPVTGDLLLSCRHSGGAFCIDYNTKEVKWALQGKTCCSNTGTYQAAARNNTTQNTKWLSVFNDPYNGPAGNHDARWHPEVPPLTPGNEVITLYDNQTDQDFYARGVVYEIDLANNRGIFRAHAHSTQGTSPWQGGFTLVKELDGSYSHVADFIYENPAVVEFNNGTNLDPNQNIVFAAAIPGNYAYRVVKVRPDQLDINFMRTTAGRTINF